MANQVELILDSLKDTKLFMVATVEKNVDVYDGQKLIEGINKYSDEFISSETRKNGFCIVDIHRIFDLINYGSVLYEITFPTIDQIKNTYPEFQIYPSKYHNCWKSNFIILGQRREFLTVDTLKYLIDLGANPHYIYDSVAIFAATQGFTEVVEFLINLGANMHGQYDLAIKTAAAEGYFEIVKLIVEKESDVIMTFHYEALKEASVNGRLDVVKYLVETLKTRAEILEKNISEQKIIHPEQIKIEERLEEILHKEFSKVLGLAAENGHLNVVEYLIDIGADQAFLNGYALRYASEKGHLNVVKYLVSKGGNINVEFYSTSPLNLAAQRGRYDVVTYLVENGATDINRALEQAFLNNHPLIVAYLYGKGAVGLPKGAAPKTPEEIVKYYTRHGIDIPSSYRCIIA